MSWVLMFTIVAQLSGKPAMSTTAIEFPTLQQCKSNDKFLRGVYDAQSDGVGLDIISACIPKGK